MKKNADIEEDENSLYIYEIMSSYFVDIFYYKLYDEAKKYQIEKKTTSLTDGYKLSLRIFNDNICSSDHYKKILKNLIHYFDEWWIKTNITDVGGLGFENCVSIMSQPFIPYDYYKSMSFSQKQIILRNIIINTLKKMIGTIINDHLGLIIDNRESNEQDIIDLLRKDLNDFFMLEKRKLYKRFIISETTGGGSVDNVSINKILLGDINSDIKRLIKEKCKYKAEKEKSEKNKKKILLILNEKIKENEQLKKELKLLREEFDALKQKENTLMKYDDTNYYTEVNDDNYKLMEENQKEINNFDNNKINTIETSNMNNDVSYLNKKDYETKEKMNYNLPEKRDDEKFPALEKKKEKLNIIDQIKNVY